MRRESQKKKEKQILDDRSLKELNNSSIELKKELKELKSYFGNRMSGNTFYF